MAFLSVFFLKHLSWSNNNSYQLYTAEHFTKYFHMHYLVLSLQESCEVRTIIIPLYREE